MLFNNLEELLVGELLDLRSTEKQLLEMLPKLQETTNSADLKEFFKELLKVTKSQGKRVELALSKLQSDSLKEEICQGMLGLMNEAEAIIKSPSTPILKDTAFIGLAQKIAHYKIASYGTAKAHSKILDLTDIAHLLQQTLEEEGSVDKKLTKIAEGSFFSTGINQKALV